MPRYWWVNHKQTFHQEVNGGFIWSPKRNSNGAFNQTYENLTLVRPGDPVVSYADKRIQAIGIASGLHREQQKSADFGAAGDAWDDIGWLVPIDWTRLRNPLIPLNHFAAIQPLLPEKHSPLNRATGAGLQGCYLAEISEQLAMLLFDLAGFQPPVEHDRRADQAQRAIEASDLESTVKEQLILARRGQGQFRASVERIERACRLTGLADGRFLVASHIKPWAMSTNAERLDGSNGLLLSPHVDRLFDRGWITFGDDGKVLRANSGVDKALAIWGLSSHTSVGSFTPAQCEYLAFHRERIFRSN